MTSDRDTLKNLLGRLMGEAGKVMRQRMDRNLSEAGFDLSTIQMILLMHVDTEAGVNQQTLTDHLLLEKTGTTRCLDALEARQLVVRVPDRVDRRQNMIFLTDEGKKLIRPIARIARTTEKQALQGIDADRVRICKEVMKQVRLNLEE